MVTAEAMATLRSAIEEIWLREHVSELRRVGIIEAAVAELVADRLDEEQRAQAVREAHKLAGSAGTFGFHRASELARELELLLGAPAVDQSIAPYAAALAEQLRAELSRATTPPADLFANSEGSAPSASPARSRPNAKSDGVLVVCHDAPRAIAIAASARGRGQEAIVISGDEAALAARTAVAEIVPAAAVVHLDEGPERLHAWLELLSELDRSGTAVVALMHTAATADRVRVLHAGARLLLDPKTAAAEIADAVATLLDTSRGSSQRVLVVDDDQTLLAAVRHILAREDVTVETLDEPERFWEVLSQVQPHLVLLDIDMPLVSGLELCRLVRSDPRWRELPVVFLSASRDAEQIREVYAAGADDFVSKPVVAPELRARIDNRLERARLHRLLVETDPLTGLANRRRLERDLTRLQLLADRYDGRLSVAVIDLDRFKRVNDRYGHAAGDQVLRRLATHLRGAFRGEDVVARLGGEEFFVAMHGMPRDDAVRRLEAVLTAFRAEGVDIGGGVHLNVGASAGVAEHRRDGVGFTELYRAADAALLAAKANGRGQVLPAGVEAATVPSHVDVAIVADDEVIAELLRHTLEIAGYGCTVLIDRAEAVERLCGRENRLTASAILLDIDLPGCGGFEVLRRLREAGVSRRSAVVVLTSRACEPQALRAVSDGAADHLLKPFSVPLLVEKLRRLVVRP